MGERNLYRINRENMKATTDPDAYNSAVFNMLLAGVLIPVESTKLERKLRDALNRICKLVPSIHRLQVLDRIAMELDAEADKFKQLIAGGDIMGANVLMYDPEGIEADALYLRRLEYDLTSMREAKASIAPKKEKTMKAGSKYESSQWPRGERP